MKTLHVGRPNLPNEELFLSLVDEIWESVWLTNDGPLVQLFEERLAEFLGVRHVIAVANATLGLEILVHALDMTKDVIMPAFTFVATPHAVSWCGGRPVFADVTPGAFAIDPDHVESLITSRTSGIIGVHTFGRPCDVAPLQDIADRYKIPLIFDAAHAFGCTYEGAKIGSFGDAEVFSFHATKVINCFEGGAITTNDPDLALTCRQMRNFGIDRGQVENLGINAKMSEVHAAMGLCSLEVYPSFAGGGRALWEMYQRRLKHIPGICLYLPSDNYHYVVMEVKRGRDFLWQYLHDHDILARRYFNPGCHHLPPYANTFPTPLLSETNQLCNHILCLPTGQQMTLGDVDRVCKVIKEGLCQG